MSVRIKGEDNENINAPFFPQVFIISPRILFFTSPRKSSRWLRAGRDDERVAGPFISRAHECGA